MYNNGYLQVEEFNASNRWKKRGINLLPMVYPVEYFPFKYNVLVAIYHNDGTVAVSHGGTECGQGINTKVQIDLLDMLTVLGMQLFSLMLVFYRLPK